MILFSRLLFTRHVLRRNVLRLTVDRTTPHSDDNEPRTSTLAFLRKWNTLYHLDIVRESTKDSWAEIDEDLSVAGLTAI
jgi:hypothetical protein